METVFNAFSLSGPAADLKVMVLALFGMGLVMAGAFMVARVIGIRIGGQDDD